MTEIHTNQLISKEKRYQEYLLKDYVAYCEEIRRSIWKQPDMGNAEIDFFEKQFVEEMEPLSKIAQHFFGKNAQNIKVQYVKDDPPDGKIIYTDSSEEICIEFTSARDNYLESVCLELNKKGILTSTSGHTNNDISGSKHKGFDINGDNVEAELLEETVEKQKALISERIQKKLNKDWIKRNNWLCVLIPDYEPPISDYEGKMAYFSLLYSVLNEIFRDNQDALRVKHINALYFVGYDSWISFHPIEPSPYYVLV